MKHYKVLHLGILCLWVQFSVLFAQENVFYVFQNQDHVTKVANTHSTPNSIYTPNYFRHHKKLSVTHSGIVLQLVTSDLPLKRDHPLFKQFGNVHYDALDGVGYAYCILTNYEDIHKAKDYLKRMILPRAPAAKVVKYQLGRRKVQ